REDRIALQGPIRDDAELLLGEFRFHRLGFDINLSAGSPHAWDVLVGFPLCAGRIAEGTRVTDHAHQAENCHSAQEPTCYGHVANPLKVKEPSAPARNFLGCCPPTILKDTTRELPAYFMEFAAPSRFSFALWPARTVNWASLVFSADSRHRLTVPKSIGYFVSLRGSPDPCGVPTAAFGKL